MELYSIANLSDRASLFSTKKTFRASLSLSLVLTLSLNHQSRVRAINIYEYYCFIVRDAFSTLCVHNQRSIVLSPSIDRPSHGIFAQSPSGPKIKDWDMRKIKNDTRLYFDHLSLSRFTNPSSTPIYTKLIFHADHQQPGKTSFRTHTGHLMPKQRKSTILTVL